MLKRKIYQQGHHEGIIALLWAQDSEIHFLPNSHRIEHRGFGSASSWGYHPARGLLQSYSEERVRIPHGAV